MERTILVPRLLYADCDNNTKQYDEASMQDEVA